MKKISKLLGLITVSAFTAGAFATTVVCNETKVNKKGTYERFTITLDRDQQLTEFREGTVKSSTGKLGQDGPLYGPTAKTKEKPLKPKYSNDDVTYHFFNQDLGDGDFPGPKENWFITIPKSGRGPGHVGTTYDSGDSGRDDYKLECK